MLSFFQVQVASPLSVAVWGVAALLISGLVCQTWFRMPEGLLQWDGTAWHWSGFEGDTPCILTQHMDFQRLLVVSVRRTGARPVWLWLEAPVGATAWMPLRRAVVNAVHSASTEPIVDGHVQERETL